MGGSGTSVRTATWTAYQDSLLQTYTAQGYFANGANSLFDPVSLTIVDGGGDGNLTRQSLPVDSNPADNRVTTFQYDWRDRQVKVTAPQDFYVVNTYDTLDRVLQVQQYVQSTGYLINQGQTLYDNRGRVYQTIRYAVDPTTGNVGNGLTDNSYYDAAGNAIAQFPSGSNGCVKMVYDNLGREMIRYLGYFIGTVTYAEASSVANDTIMEQVETTYDAASNVTLTTTRQRFHNATGTGPLTEPGGTQPVARVTYAVSYPDGVGRTQAVADYGTNGDVTLTAPATVPASSSGVLVSLTAYNSRGEAYQTTDPAGLVS